MSNQHHGSKQDMILQDLFDKMISETDVPDEITQKILNAAAQQAQKNQKQSALVQDSEVIKFPKSTPSVHQGWYQQYWFQIAAAISFVVVAASSFYLVEHQSSDSLSAQQTPKQQQTSQPNHSTQATVSPKTIDVEPVQPYQAAQQPIQTAPVESAPVKSPSVDTSNSLNRILANNQTQAHVDQAQIHQQQTRTPSTSHQAAFEDAQLQQATITDEPQQSESPEITGRPHSQNNDAVKRTLEQIRTTP